MKNFFVSIVSFICLFFSSTGLFAQVPDALGKQLSGKRKLTDIMKTVTAFYQGTDTVISQLQTGEPERETNMLHWARWALYMSSRTDSKGEIPDITQKTISAQIELDKRVTKHNTEGTHWKAVGPQATFYGVYAGRGLGRVDRLAFHPTDPDIMYAGTPSGGLYSTYNGGGNWINISAYLPVLGIAGIVVSHANANTLYILTGDGDSHFSSLTTSQGFVESFGYAKASNGVWKTINGGQSWVQVAPLDTPGTYIGYHLVQHPKNANVLLAATSKGIFRTDNGGNSWTKVYDTLTTSLAYQPGKTNPRLYAGGQRVAKFSTDDGITWQTSSLNRLVPGSVRRLRLTVSKADSLLVYFYTGGSLGYVYRSLDGGVSYTERGFNSLASPDAYNASIAVSQTNTDNVIVGGTSCFRSTTAGSGLFRATNYFESDDPNNDISKYVHPDIHDLAYNPLNNHLFAATDGGVWKSTNDGANWTDISTGIDAAQVYHIAARATHADTIICGNQDNGVTLREGGTDAFRHLASGDGYSLSLSPGSPGEAYASINTTIQRFSNNYASRSQVRKIDGEWFPNVVSNPADPTMVFAGYSSIYKKSGNSFTFPQLPNSPSGNQAMANCPSNANRYYAAGGVDAWDPYGRLGRTNDAGNNWLIISNSTKFPKYEGRPKITDVAVHPANSDYVWVSFGGYDTIKVYFSPNAGDNWIRMDANLPNVPINCLAIDNNNNAYAGTDIGIFFLASGDDEWVPLNNGLPRVPVTDILIHQPTNSLTASTFGRGVWRAAMYNSCPSLLYINWEMQGDNYFTAAGNITANSAINGQISGTTVVMRSADSIKLLPGFQVKAGDKFRGYIGNCSSGAPIYKAGATNPEVQQSIEVLIDNTTAVLDAVIQSVTFENEVATLTCMTKKEGKLNFILTDLNRNAIISTGELEKGKGTFEEKIPLHQLKPGKYYLHLVIDGKVMHYQELVVP